MSIFGIRNNESYRTVNEFGAFGIGVVTGTQAEIVARASLPLSTALQNLLGVARANVIGSAVSAVDVVSAYNASNNLAFLSNQLASQVHSPVLRRVPILAEQWGR